jgi:hypothetical protein
VAATLRVRYPTGHIPDEDLKASVSLSAKKFPAFRELESFVIVFTKNLVGLIGNQIFEADILCTAERCLRKFHPKALLLASQNNVELKN